MGKLSSSFFNMHCAAVIILHSSFSNGNHQIMETHSPLPPKSNLYNKQNRVLRLLLQKCNLGPRASTLCYLIRNLHLSKGEETRVWGSQNCDHTRKFHKSKSRKEGRIYTWFNRANRHSYHFEYLVCFIVLPEVWSLKANFSDDSNGSSVSGIIS